MNAYPAGYSSEEDEFDEFGFEDDRPKKSRTIFEPRILTKEEKLIEAICNNDVNAAKEVLDEGADIHLKSTYSSDHSPIMKAASFGSFEVMELLIRRGANVNDESKMFNVIMCLCHSTLQDETVLLKCLNLLLENGANPLATDWVGATPVMHAAQRGRQLLVAKLLESGSSVNQADGDGWTPLFYAVQNGHIELTKLLIDSGGDINISNRFGETLWDLAASKNDEDLSALVTPEELKEVVDGSKEVVDNYPFSCQFKRIMSTAPKLGNRMFGFHEDAIRFLHGIGLDYVATHMDKNDLQLAELLTWNENEWKEAGIRLSFPLRKIDLCVKKYHEKEWGKGSIPNMLQLQENEKLDLFLVVQQLMSLLRNVHIASATSLYIRKNYHEPLSSEMEKEIEIILKTTSTIKKQLNIISSIIQNVDNSTVHPPDLIAPRRSRTERFYPNFILDALCKTFLHTIIHVISSAI